MSDRLQVISESEAFQAFKDHCKSNFEQEMCGLFLLGAGGEIAFVPCDNHAYDKRNSFLVHPVDFVNASKEGDVIAVGHSHIIVSADPSPEDMNNSENCRIPFVIFQPNTEAIGWYEPTGQVLPLLGRKWHLGVSDCYTLARDYYRSQGVQLRDYIRNEYKTLRTDSMFLQHFEAEGFKVVTGQKAKLHDGFLMQIAADIPNHCAMMVEDGIILHHLQHRLSCREPYAGYWRRHTMIHLRHEKWL